jgi:hypothetical protein
MVHPPPPPPSPPCVTLPCAPPLVLCLLQGHCATLGVGTATAPAPHPSSYPLLPLCPPTYMQPLLSLIHICISFSLSLIGLRPVCSCSSVSTTVWHRRGFLPRGWLTSHSAALNFLGGRVGFSCAFCSLPPGCLFCVPRLSCVISACCACSGPTVTAYLVLPAYVGGGGGPPPSPLVPTCSFLASWWAVPDARCAMMVVLLAGNPIGLDGAAGLAALDWAPSIVQ